MPQQFQVVRCCNCEKFQIHHIKKAKKWNCKVCDEKQSFIKVYFIGSAQECRSVVQQNNMREGEKKVIQMFANKCDSTDNYMLSSKKIKLYDETECLSSEFKCETIEKDVWSGEYFEKELNLPQNKYNHGYQSTQVIFQSTSDLLTEQFRESLENNQCTAITTNAEQMQLPVKNESSNGIILQNKTCVETIEKLKKPTLTKNIGFQKILEAAKKVN